MRVRHFRPQDSPKIAELANFNDWHVCQSRLLSSLKSELWQTCQFRAKKGWSQHPGGVQGFTERMPLSPMLSSVGSAHLQSGMPSDAVAGAEAMWQLSNHLNSLQLQQAPLPGAASCILRSLSAQCWPLLWR